MGNTSGRHVLHYAVLFSSGLMLMFALALVYYHQDQQRQFVNHDRQLSERTVANVVTQIDLYIEKQRRTVSLFGHAHFDELATLPHSLPNTPLQTPLWNKLAGIESTARNYTLADSEGRLLLSDPQRIVGRGCQNDILFYANNDYPNDLFIHKNDIIGDHIDVVTPLRKHEDDDPLFFFVSLNLIELTDILRLGEADQHTLMLTSADGTIQLTSKGRAKKRPKLSTSEVLTLTQATIPGTRWKLVDTVPKDTYSQHARELTCIGVSIFTLLSLLGLPLLWLISREEQGLLAAKAELVKSHALLETLLEKRTSALLQSKNDLDYLSRYDLLTGLLNRQTFTLAIVDALDQKHSTYLPSTLAYLDLDQFSLFNDVAGHNGGDQLLIQTAEALQNLLPEDAIISRLSGDLYGIFLQETDIDNAKHIFSLILKKLLSETLRWEGAEYRISASVGLRSIPANARNIQKYQAEADSAVHQSKAKGKGIISIYQQSNSELARKNGINPHSLNVLNAIKENRLTLYQQSIVPLQKEAANEQRIEVLVRMYDEDGSLILPNDFIPAAEQYGQMPDLDYWVTENTLNWMEDQTTPPYVHINLSGQSLTNEQCITRLESLLQETPHKVLRHLCFEITETIAVKDYSQAIQFIQTVRNLGGSFALDDYGSGVCSFSYLRNLPVDILKIDGELVRSIADDEVNAAMVASIVSMSKAMKLSCVAEFIEDETAAQRLGEMGVDYGQGYFFSKPEKLKN